MSNASGLAALINKDPDGTHEKRRSIFRDSGLNDWGRFLLARISDENAQQSERTIAFLSLCENIGEISKSWSSEDYAFITHSLESAAAISSSQSIEAKTLLPEHTDIDEALIDGKFVQRICVRVAEENDARSSVEFGHLRLDGGQSYILTSEYDKSSNANDTLEILDLETGQVLDRQTLVPGYNRFADSEIDLTDRLDSCEIGFRISNLSESDELFWYQCKAQNTIDDRIRVSAIDALANVVRDERAKANKAIFTPVTGEPLTLPDIDRLSALQNKFAGERIFVMGNGPSLNKTPLDKLENEFVFGLNRVSLLFDRVSWKPTFFTAFDVRVVPDNQEEFANLDIEYKFFSARYKKILGEKPNHYWHHTKGFYDGFESCFEPTVPYTGFGGGGTIAIMAIELAFFMGFREIYLIGTDVSYTVPKSVVQSGEEIFGDGVKLNLESTKDDDANHFDPRYFGAGKKWHNPNVRDMKIGFARTASYIDQRGGKLLNATVGGELDQVQRVDFDSLF